MELDLGKEEKLIVKYGGTSYEVSFPSVKQVMAFNRSVKGRDGEEVECFLDFLPELGLPKEIAEKLSMKHVQLLGEHLLGVSKKN